MFSGFHTTNTLYYWIYLNKTNCEYYLFLLHIKNLKSFLNPLNQKFYAYQLYYSAKTLKNIPLYFQFFNN